MAAYADLVHSGRTPGDDLAERAERDGPLAALVASPTRRVRRCVRHIALDLEQARARTLTLTEIDEVELTRSTTR